MDPTVVSYYKQYDEHGRLSQPWGQLEFTRTMELLRRHLPPPPARVVDIGGATGPYSETLGKLGYEMHLLDLMPHYVEAAARRPGVASATQGDARALPWSDAYADAALLMGPMYHLTDKKDRAKALGEVRRVLRPGGVVAAAAINRFASLMDGLVRGLVTNPQFRTLLIEDLATGQHRNPSDNIEYFTSAYFHLPAELEDELTAAGFDEACVFAVEGPGWLAHASVEQEFLLELLRKVEREPTLIGVSPHLLAFAVTPTGGGPTHEPLFAAPRSR